MHNFNLKCGNLLLQLCRRLFQNPNAKLKIKTNWCQILIYQTRKHKSKPTAERLLLWDNITASRCVYVNKPLMLECHLKQKSWWHYNSVPSPSRNTGKPGQVKSYPTVQSMWRDTKNVSISRQRQRSTISIYPFLSNMNNYQVFEILIDFNNKMKCEILIDFIAFTILKLQPST